MKDRWYVALDDVLSRVPRHDMLVVLGDMNAKVGRELIRTGDWASQSA